MREKMSNIEVSVEVTGEGIKSVTVSEGDLVLDLVLSLDWNPEAVVVKRNGKIVPEEEGLEEGDEVEIIPVVSGG